MNTRERKANIRPILDPNLYPDEVKADKWRNLYFRINGETDEGEEVFYSESEAELSAKNHFFRKRSPRHKVMWKGCFIPSMEVTHSVPMPVKS